MNPISTIDNDLQKAIDDITNNTNTDPAFSEPVATPAPVDTPAAPVEPAPLPEAPAPAEPAKPFPTVGETPITSTFNPAPRPTIPEAPGFAAPIAAPATEPVAEPAPVVPEAPAPETVVAAEETTTEVVTNPDKQNVKEVVLRDLAPIVDKIDMDPTEKFDLYKNIREELHDDSVIASAYKVSKEITDEGKRADALLYLYDSLK